MSWRERLRLSRQNMKFLLFQYFEIRISCCGLWTFASDASPLSRMFHFPNNRPRERNKTNKLVCHVLSVLLPGNRKSDYATGKLLRHESKAIKQTDARIHISEIRFLVDNARALRKLFTSQQFSKFFSARRSHFVRALWIYGLRGHIRKRSYFRG